MELLNLIIDRPIPVRYIKETRNLGDGETLLVIDYEKTGGFKTALCDLGWECVKTFEVGETRGAYYTLEGRGLYFYSNSKARFARAAYGASLPTDDTEVGTPVYDGIEFCQLSNAMPGSGGMTYLVRMRDGRFIIIDGAHVHWKFCLDEMARLAPLHDPEKPFEVAAWFITHPHSDHVDVLFHLFERPELISRLNIKRMYFNVPHEGILSTRDHDVLGDSLRLCEVAAKLKEGGTEVYKPYAGMSFGVGELTAEVYYTQAEWQMIPTMWTINDSSLTFTLKGENTKKVMILGDIMNGAGNVMLQMYSKETLSDSDIVQVAHHALYGPDFPLYETIDPECTFWPIAPPGYAKYAHVIPRNNKLRRMCIPHYMASFGEVTVTL